MLNLGLSVARGDGSVSSSDDRPGTSEPPRLAAAERPLAAPWMDRTALAKRRISDRGELSHLNGASQRLLTAGRVSLGAPRVCVCAQVTCLREAAAAAARTTATTACCRRRGADVAGRRLSESRKPRRRRGPTASALGRRTCVPMTAPIAIQLVCRHCHRTMAIVRWRPTAGQRRTCRGPCLRRRSARRLVVPRQHASVAWRRRGEGSNRTAARTRRVALVAAAAGRGC
jgi:hypothetical protein